MDDRPRTTDHGPQTNILGVLPQDGLQTNILGVLPQDGPQTNILGVLPQDGLQTTDQYPGCSAPGRTTDNHHCRR